LAPLLIHAHCDATDGCQSKFDAETRTPLEAKLIAAYEQELVKMFEETERTRVVLQTDISEARQIEIERLAISGIKTANGSVIANPTQVIDAYSAAQELSPLLGIDVTTLQKNLQRRPKRYIEVAHKITPEITQEILKLKNDPQYYNILRGVQLRDEHWRFYPERTLGAQMIGFVDADGVGQYGIEGRFDPELAGEKGLISGSISAGGKSLLKNLGIQQALDGSDIVLSIDRVIQDTVENILATDVERFDADFGQVIVIEPQTGRILAMAHAPTFDPNEFGDVFTTYEIPQEQEESDRADEKFNQRIPSIVSNGSFYRYFNTWGPEVFRNKSIADEYEPGSVIKAFTMSAALNTNEVLPYTTYLDTGPIEVEEFKIRNADNKYLGETTMIDVLNRSLNTGIAFLTRKMGAQMVYEYFKKFGFGEYTDIPLDGETKGQLEFWQDWGESELITRGFGQGMTANPLQVAMAFASLANGGYLMKPLLVEEITHRDGTNEIFEPERLRRVISEETYHTIKAMLLQSVEKGVARGARIFGYNIMGKTGTSQTYKNGKALSGEGTTIASFAGFGPMETPRFVILVKMDYPKASQWGSETASMTFKQIAIFLLEYFQIPPEK
jgi:cell division protein FtsI/penicillin-binding protein 2